MENKMAKSNKELLPPLLLLLFIELLYPDHVLGHGETYSLKLIRSSSNNPTGTQSGPIQCGITIEIKLVHFLSDSYRHYCRTLTLPLRENREARSWLKPVGSTVLYPRQRPKEKDR